MKKPQNKFITLWLIIGIVAGFAGVVFFVINYLQKKVLCEMQCTHSQAVVVSLILIALFGLFIGSLTYYFISEKKKKEINKISKKAQKGADMTLNFLENNERKIVKAIIDSDGEILQSKLVKKTGLSRVAISRNISDLEKKEVIEKEKSGMTNLIKLEKSLIEIFC